MNQSRMRSANARSGAVAVTAVGTPRLTSSAWLGPESTPIRPADALPRVSATTSESNAWVPCSIPFEQITNHRSPYPSAASVSHVSRT